jgi:hypothetical protein
MGVPLAVRATLVNSRDRPILAPDLAGAMAQAGVDPTREGRALHDALRAAIATRRGYCSWDVDHAGWVVTLHSPNEQDFSGKTLEEALAWCLVWLMAPELGIGPFLVASCGQRWHVRLGKHSMGPWALCSGPLNSLNSGAMAPPSSPAPGASSMRSRTTYKQVKSLPQTD